MVTATIVNSKKSIANTSTLVVAANSGRKGLVLCNDSDEDIYISFGAAAVKNEGILIGVDQRYEVNDINLIVESIYAICASGSKNLSYIEVTSTV